MNEQRWKKILLAAGAVFTLIFCLTPFVYTVLTSLSLHPDFLARDVAFVPTGDHYYDVLARESLHFVDYLANSFVISFLSAVLCVFIASLGAYAMTRLPLPAKPLIMVGILAISMFPQLSLISYLFKLMTALGWINTYPALIFPYTAWTLPISFWILVSYFNQIPDSLDKAGLIDGCSRWQILWKIIYPVAKPGLFSTFLLAFLYAFNEFMFALILTTDHQARTIPVGIALFEGLHGQIPWGTIMAASTIAIIPVVGLTVAFQRHIIQGLTRGAIKE